MLAFLKSTFKKQTCLQAYLTHWQYINVNDYNDRYMYLLIIVEFNSVMYILPTT